MAVITISRQYGSGADAIARRVCELLDYKYFDKELMAKVASEVELTQHDLIDYSEDSYKVRNFFELLLQPGPRYVGHVRTVTQDTSGKEILGLKQLDEEQCNKLIRSTIRIAYRKGNVVIVGRGGQAILQNKPNALHVRIISPLAYRIDNIRRTDSLYADEAQQRALEKDQAAMQYLRRFYNIQWDDPLYYHLVIDTEKWTTEAVAQVICTAAKQIAVKTKAAK
jgi:CMP/dCMP kinase